MGTGKNDIEMLLEIAKAAMDFIIDERFYLVHITPTPAKDGRYYDKRYGEFSVPGSSKNKLYDAIDKYARSWRDNG